MSELQNIFLTIITENQTQKIKAEKLAKLTQSELGNDWDILTIEKYHKYDNSYKIEFKKTFMENHPDKINH